MAQLRVRQVDMQTGEVLEGFAAVVFPRQHNGFGRRWFAMSQDALSVLMQVRSAQDHRVLFALLTRLDFENLLVVSQADIAAELDMRPQHVGRSVKRLVELGALLEGPRIGVHRSYRLNPAFGWKGSAKNHQKALRDRMRVVQGGKE